MVVAFTWEAKAQQGTWGKFEGTVVAEWLENGRAMKLLKDFAYGDRNDVRWVAPANSEVDGASIPQVFWSFIGGPFEGKYRNASVVHDVACQEKSRPWESVHLMFYEASRLGGVGLLHAKVMYFAVYHWGPRWETEQPRLLKTNDDFLRGREYIVNHEQIDLPQIRGLTSEFLAREIPKVSPPFKISPDESFKLFR